MVRRSRRRTSTSPRSPTLTVSRMLAQLDACIARHAPGPVTLIGSSLGGFPGDSCGRSPSSVCRRAASGHPARVARASHRFSVLGETVSCRHNQIATWKAAGHHEFFHHAYDRPEPVGFALYEDAQQYDAFDVPLEVPALVFQGRRDVVVKPSERHRLRGGAFRSRPATAGRRPSAVGGTWISMWKGHGLVPRTRRVIPQSSRCGTVRSLASSRWRS